MLTDYFGLSQENVLLDSEGHIKVTDFGLAKHGMNDEARTNSFIGTMEVPPMLSPQCVTQVLAHSEVNPLLAAKS